MTETGMGVGERGSGRGVGHPAFAIGQSPAICPRRPGRRQGAQPGQELAATFLLATLVFASEPLWAFGPGNDVCSGAEQIPSFISSFAWVTTVTEVGDASTNGDPAFSCEFSDNSSVTNSLWYRFTPGETAIYTLSSCAEAPTATTVRDTVMAIFIGTTNGCDGPLIQVTDTCYRQGCGDDSCGPGGLQAAITTRLLKDTNYFIVLWRYDDGLPPEAGHTKVQLRVEKSEPRLNDKCDAATSLDLNIPVFGTTVGATNDYWLSGSACLTNGSGNVPSPAMGPDVVYSFTPTEAGSYSFKVFNYSAARTNDLVLYLLSSCPAGSLPIAVSNCLAAANRSTASTGEEIPCVPLAANQEVYLVVDDDGCMPGSAFTVEVTRCLSESEPNNSPATATALRCGITGTIDPIGDLDYFSLGSPAAGSRLFALVDGEAANVSRFDLRVTTTADTLEYDDKDNDAAFGNFSPNLAGTPLTGTETFLQVSSEFSARVGPYRLYATVQPPLSFAEPETEPNNDTPQANSSPTNYFYGTLATNPPPADPFPSTDVDVYSFTARAGDLVFLSLDGDPLRDDTPAAAKLDLLDAEGNLITGVSDGLNLSTNCTPRFLSDTFPGTGSLFATRPYSPAQGMVYRTPTSGTFFARVSIATSCHGPRSAGDYLLSISRNCPMCCVPVQARFVAIIPSDNTRVRMQLRGGPGNHYLIESSSDLTTWTHMGSRTAQPDGLFEFEDSVTPAAARFYRAAWTW